MAHRNLAPVRSLAREMIPVVGSFAFGGTYSEPLKDFADVGSGALDTIIESADNTVVSVQLVGDSATSAGVTIDEANGHVVIHFEDGVSTVGDVETAIGSATLIAVETAGTGATVLAAATDEFGDTLLEEQAQPTDEKGLGYTVAHTAVGTHVVTFTNKWGTLVDFDAQVQLVDGSVPCVVQVGSYVAASRTVTIVTLGTGTPWAAADMAVDADNRLHFEAWFRHTDQLPARG